MPNPKKGEKKNDFLHRCVSEVVHTEGADPKQAVAMCYSKWNEHKENKKKEDSVALKFWKWFKGIGSKDEKLVQCGNCLKLLDYNYLPKEGEVFIKCTDCGKFIDQEGNYFKNTNKEE